MSLNAGEVFVVVGAKLDSAALARAKSSFDEIEASSNRAQAAVNASSTAQRRAMADYAASAKRGEDATKRLEQSLSRAKDAAVLTGKVGALGVAGIATALGGAALAAVGFDSAMRNVNSIAGLSQKQFDALEKQVLRLAPSLGSTPKELAAGLYDIVSTGFKASDAIKILAVSAKAGKAGLTDTATATDAITSALKSYGEGAGSARKVSDLLFETVDVGKLNFQQLATSIGTVLPSAATLGVPLKELGAAIATITLNGTDAKTATTQLSAIFTAFQKPTKDLTKVFHDQGYETATAGLKALGLKGSLDLLRKQVDGGHETWVSFFKDVRALRGAQGLEGTAHAADLFATSTKAMDEATKGAGATQAAFAEQSKSTAVQFDKLKAGIDVAAITIGQALLPKLNEGIQALSHWFAQAEKSGDIDRWANDVSGAVDEILTEIHKLGPDAEAAFHVIASTVQAALPFVEKLYEIFQDVEPAIADVVKAGAGLAQVLGPGPILGAVGAFKALQTAGLGAQAGIGKFAKVMQAGSLAIAGTADGGVAAGKITKIGEEAVGSASKVKIFATGLAKTIGNPNLIAAGAAGIVVSILYIKSTMTSLKNETQDVVDALAELQGDRISVAAAKIAKARADTRLDVATKTAGSRAVDLARVTAADQRPTALRLAAPSRAEIQATNDLAAANLNVRDAANQRDHAEAVLAAAEGKRTADQTKLAQQLEGAGQKAIESNQHHQLTTDQATGGRFGPDQLTAAQRERKAVDDLVSSLRKQFDAETDLDKAGKAAGNRVADVIDAIGKIPSKAQYKIIADDVAAGKSLAKIKRDLGVLDKTTATPKIDADPTDANRDIDDVTGKANALNALRPQVHLGASGFDGVRTAIDGINQRILHLTSSPFTVKVNYATSGTVPNPTGVDKKKARATGGKVDGAEVALIGEDGPEYVVPVGDKHRAAGIELWMAAGKDLGIPGYAKGKKPGKTPPPIKRGLGYDPQALDAQEAEEKSRLDKAHSYRDELAGRLTTDTGHRRELEKELATAKRGTSSKSKKTAAAARARVVAIQAEMRKLDSKLIGEANAHQHQVEVVIPADTKRYQDATRAAKIGDDHAKQITLWQDRADTATSAMSLASSQWDAADRKKDQAGRDKAYKAWDAARKERISDLGHVKSLLQEVQKVVGKTDYGAQIAKSLTDTLGDIVSAQDDTAAPGYEAPDDSAPSTNIADYLNPFEQTELQQVAYGEAVASTTDDTQDDVDAANVALGVANQIADRLQRDGAPIDVITQAYQAIASAKSDLASAVTANTPNAPQITADQQAQLDQANARATAAEKNAASAAASLAVFQGSGDLFRGGGASVTINTLHPADPAIQRAVGEYVAGSFGSQPSVLTSRSSYDG